MKPLPMKPLPPAPLTETDEEIWSSVGWMYEKSGVHVWGACFEISLESDRRDAELMFERMNHWEWGRTPPHKWWFEDWPGPDGRSRTPFDDACYT
jgi:hypothetical protein